MKNLKDILGKYNASPSRKNFASKADKHMKECFDFLTLVKQWKDIVGDKLAEKTMPQGIYKDQLVVVTNHPAFSEQLSFMESVLLKKVFQAFPSLNGKLKRLIFKYDSAKFKHQTSLVENTTQKNDLKKIIHPLSPEFKKLKTEAGELFSHIEDEELKEQLTSIYIQSSVNKK